MNNTANQTPLAGKPEISGNIYKIQRFCINDGPGIRTTVFLKGCQLSCKWCHNPETISCGRNLLVNRQLCVYCGKCAAVCPQKCHSVGQNSHEIDRQLCRFCGRCVALCPAKAIEIIGRQITVAEAMAVIKRDEDYYKESGGGVTISGGEPALQPCFARALTDACKEMGFTVYIDTNGSVSPDTFNRLTENCDGVLFDIKIINSRRHQYYTGSGNSLIMQNFRALCSASKDVIVRYVVIPSINDSGDDLELLRRFLKECRFGGSLEFLAYHTLGANKYASMDMSYELGDIAPPSRQQMNEIVNYFTIDGFNAFYRN